MSARLLGASEVLATFDVDGSERESALRPWRDLAARAQVPNVFLSPELLLPAVRHLADDRVVLAVVSRDDRWRILLPLRLRTRCWTHPVRGAVTWEHQQSFLGTPLVSEDVTTEDWAELLEVVAGSGDRWLLMRQLDAGVADRVAAVATARGGAGVRVRSTDRGWTLATGGEPIRPDLSAKRRRELRRQRRRLDERLGGRLVVEDLAAHREGEDDEARRRRVRADLAHFLALERAGWKGDDGGAMAVRPAEAAFFVESCLAALDRDALLLPALHDGTRLVAAAALLREREVVSWWKTTYDEAYADLAPGWIVAVESFELMGEDVRALDSCTDADSRLGTSLTTGRRELTTLAVSTDVPLGRRVVLRLPAWLAARDRGARAVARARAGLRRARAGTRRWRRGSTSPA